MGPQKMETEEAWLEWVRKKLVEAANNDNSVDYETFILALKIKDSFFVRRFFECLTRGHGAVVQVDTLLAQIMKLTNGTGIEKLKFLFDVHDVDGSGTIDVSEMKTVLQSCLAESAIRLSDETLDTLTILLFEDADQDGDGQLTFDELKGEFEKHPDIVDSLTLNASHWLKTTPRIVTKKCDDGRKRISAMAYCERNVRLVAFVAVYVVINIALFILNAVRYRHGNAYVIIARGFGMGLNFNCAFIVVLVMRKCLNFLRARALASLLPFDEAIDLHKLVGVVIALQSVGHTLAHFGNLYLVINAPVTSNVTSSSATANVTSSPLGWADYLFTLRSGVGFVPGFAWLSGILLFVVLAVMLLLALPVVRRRGYFQVFYWSHTLYVVFWVLCILHGPIFWYFFIVPGSIYVIERIYRLHLFKVAAFGKVFIKEVHLLPSKVTQLVIEKPTSLHYQPGDYVFVKIPAIAEHEWHPFTISSAPEMEDEFWLHIRSAGDWTNKLYKYFDTYESLEDTAVNAINDNTNDVLRPQSIHIEKRQKDSFNGVGGIARRRTLYRSIKKITVQPEGEANEAFVAAAGDNRMSANKKKRLSIKTSNASLKKDHSKKVHVEIYVDGPYGTPSREIFDTEHAILVGAGIGVTPYASILQSVMHRYLTVKRTCNQCNHSWFGEIPHELMKVKKVDFIWINRDQRCFEWFVSLLASLELMQQEEGGLARLLDMHMYMTSALTKDDMKGVCLQMALELYSSSSSRDVITGLKTRTQPGRPDWDALFKEISANRAGKVKVFVCGPQPLSTTIKKYAEKYNFDFCKENF